VRVIGNRILNGKYSEKMEDGYEKEREFWEVGG
jgi:hypothetical protein